MRHYERLNSDKEFLFPMSETARNRYVRELGVLVEFLDRKSKFSLATFGPGHRLEGVLDHIRKELVEVERAPWELDEWIDIVILALDGAARQGHPSQAIVAMLIDKWRKVESRDYPNWRDVEPGKAIEHVRTPEEQAAKFEQQRETATLLDTGEPRGGSRGDPREVPPPPKPTTVLKGGMPRFNMGGHDDREH